MGRTERSQTAAWGALRGPQGPLPQDASAERETLISLRRRWRRQSERSEVWGSELRSPLVLIKQVGKKLNRCSAAQSTTSCHLLASGNWVRRVSFPQTEKKKLFSSFCCFVNSSHFEQNCLFKNIFLIVFLSVSTKDLSTRWRGRSQREFCRNLIGLSVQSVCILKVKFTNYNPLKHIFNNYQLRPCL